MNLTQTAIKDSLDLSTAARISEYETGKRKPSLIVTLGYSHLAKVPMASLVDDEISLNTFWNQLHTPDYKELQNIGKQPVSPAQTKVPNYTVHPPLTFGRRYQQIRATIQGTPQIAGSLEINPSSRGKAVISNLHVDQQHRRRGVAAKLIGAVINTARRQGFNTARLEARPFGNGISLQALVAMYRRQGFRSVGKTSRGSPGMELKL
ncbi:MAG TPA: GNAT family N-acetyltransferase [Pyrinomonadaceae bacterium]|nr:GNAT family N-acetyltransferase [Pyrinomonadaceae bacterium]